MIPSHLINVFFSPSLHIRKDWACVDCTNKNKKRGSSKHTSSSSRSRQQPAAAEEERPAAQPKATPASSSRAHRHKDEVRVGSVGRGGRNVSLVWEAVVEGMAVGGMLEGICYYMEHNIRKKSVVTRDSCIREQKWLVDKTNCNMKHPVTVKEVLAL